MAVDSSHVRTAGEKVAVVLVELDLSFDSVYLDFIEVKQVAHTSSTPVVASLLSLTTRTDLSNAVR
ncbi:hypothetical protein BKA93DRAFT_824385 [Sparassis latifolia]